MRRFVFQFVFGWCERVRRPHYLRSWRGSALPISQLGLVCCALATGLNTTLAQNWTLTSAPSKQWVSVTSAADGTKLAAAAFPGIFTSTNAGATWRSNDLPVRSWTGVAASANGGRLFATIGAYSVDHFFSSTNFGTTWTSNNTPTSIPAIVSAADGIKLIGMTGGPQIYISTNAGATWTIANLPSAAWNWAASSADGRVCAVVGNGPIYSSTNSGVTWISNQVIHAFWYGVACSADGRRIFATASANGVPSLWTSTDSGANWSSNAAPSYLDQIVSSADGTKLASWAYMKQLYFSTDSGATWSTGNSANANWTAVAASADGARLAACARGGGIFTAQSTPAPKLNLAVAGTNLALSWVVPSTSFVLQQSSDLSTANWITVTNAPALNMTNLELQVSLPVSQGAAFYRLSSP